MYFDELMQYRSSKKGSKHQQDRERVAKCFKNCHVSMAFIFSMIEDIQDLAKFSKGNQMFSIQPAFFNTNRFLDEAVSPFRHICSVKGLQLIIRIDDNVPKEIYADKKRIKQILMNMVSNAVKFTTKGSISVKFKMIEKEPEPEELTSSAAANSQTKDQASKQ